jgi:hypothetical protein
VSPRNRQITRNQRAGMSDFRVCPTSGCVRLQGVSDFRVDDVSRSIALSAVYITLSLISKLTTDVGRYSRASRWILIRRVARRLI